MAASWRRRRSTSTRPNTTHFDQAGYDARIATTRAAMAAGGIELLVVSDPSNMAWLTGHDDWSFYVHHCVLVVRDDAPVWFGRGQDATGAQRICFMGADDIVGYPDHYGQSTERHPVDRLAVVIADRGWAEVVIGVEMDNDYFSAATFATLRQGLAKATFKDATVPGDLPQA